MATTAAAQTKEHETYAINLTGYGKREYDETHIVQINIFILHPLPLHAQRMAFNNEILLGGVIRIYYLFGVGDFSALICCLQFTLFNITHRNQRFLRWRAWLTVTIK